MKESDESLVQSIKYGKLLTENRIRDLIRKLSESNNLPKLDKRKYTGKYLKDDYLIALIDILRENFDGDYSLIMDYLYKESISQQKKGFGA